MDRSGWIARAQARHHIEADAAPGCEGVHGGKVPSILLVDDEREALRELGTIQ